jgi:hypothetical protein
MTTKRDRNKIMKAYSNIVNGSTDTSKSRPNRPNRQKQIQILERVPLQPDEFTKHKELKHALIDFIDKARDLEESYRAHRKQMIQEIGLRLEDELKRLGKPELISHISEELINILRQARIKWNAIYLRRCLPERYKNPVKSKNALAREYPGVPEDSGRTIEQLEAALEAERKKTATATAVATIGEYVVKSDLKFIRDFGSQKEVNTFITKELIDTIAFSVVKDDSGRTTHARLTMTYPVIIKVNVKERDATIEMDMDAYSKLVKSRSSSK